MRGELVGIAGYCTCVYVYRYKSICILSLYTACLPAKTIYIEACSSLELLYESFMCALPDDVYDMYVCMSTLH